MSNNEETETAEAERGIPSLKKEKNHAAISQKTMFIMMLIGAAILLVLVNFDFNSSTQDNEPSMGTKIEIKNVLGLVPELINDNEEEKKADVSEQETKEETLDTNKVADIQDFSRKPGYQQSYSQQTEANIYTPDIRKREEDILIGGTQSTTKQQGRRLSSYAKNDNDALAGRLKATRLKGSQAALIKNRDMVITKGTFLKCALETAISSALPGMTSCRITNDIYSTSGNVILLDRGSRVVGQYQSDLKQGQARIFILWTRVETPEGVVIELNSPGTGALGRAGVGGEINTHFWKRFGGALLLSLVSSGSELAANTEQSQRTQILMKGISSSSRTAAQIALDNSINIPPTLEKEPGESISIFVARDLDFEGVYELELE